jgi:PAS domain S-box-containing protein
VNSARLSPDASARLDFLHDGGEMGALMRRHVWTGSPLGPPAGWPQSLRTVVRLMLNTGHPMYVFWGPELACLYNDAYRESIGPERHPGSLGRPAREIWAEIWPVIGPQIEQVMSGRGATWHVDQLVPITRHTGVDEVYWTYSYSPIDDERAAGGIGGVLVVCTETTRQVVAARQLAHERERLRLALSAGRMGAYELDIEADTLWWSPETYDVFGVSANAFTLTRESALELVHPDDRAGFLRRRSDAIAQRLPFFDEVRIRRPDGSSAWIGYRGQAEYDAQGRPVRTFGIVLDITDRKHAEQILREADREKDDFIATLSHELRNPLAPIRNAVAVLRQLDPGDPRVAWCHGVIGRQTEQMAHLLDDLLDVSRLTRRQLTLRLHRLDLATALAQSIEIAQPVIDAAGHELEVALPAERVELDGDLIRLAQVFSNVLINAAKYTPAKGRIAVSIRREAREASVTIRDSGIGIAAEHIAQIFEMFGQVESSRNRAQGGQGIGLSLAKGLIELHGGTIKARSDGIGKGSEFEIRLPLPASSATPA